MCGIRGTGTYNIESTDRLPLKITKQFKKLPLKITKQFKKLPHINTATKIPHKEYSLRQRSVQVIKCGRGSGGNALTNHRLVGS